MPGGGAGGGEGCRINPPAMSSALCKPEFRQPMGEREDRNERATELTAEGKGARGRAHLPRGSTELRGPQLPAEDEEAAPWHLGFPGGCPQQGQPQRMAPCAA